MLYKDAVSCFIEKLSSIPKDMQCHVSEGHNCYCITAPIVSVIPWTLSLCYSHICG